MFSGLKMLLFFSILRAERRIHFAWSRDQYTNRGSKKENPKNTMLCDYVTSKNDENDVLTHHQV